MKALMYHYVRKFDKEFPYSKFKDLDTFSYEILALQELGYTFMNVTDAIKSLINKEDTSKVILLTFDDGLKDHISVARILNKLGIKKATFYISTKPYLTNSILHVHKSHLILSSKGEKALDFLLEANAEDPANPDILNYLGLCSAKLGLNENAEIYYLLGLELNDQHNSIKYNLGVFYKNQNRTRDYKEVLNSLKNCGCEEYKNLKKLTN